MLSKAIVQNLKANAELAALVGGANMMFAERGHGDICLIVLQNSKRRVAPEIDSVKVTRIQIIVNGYDIDSGEVIAVKALKALEALEGRTLTTDEFEYEVKDVHIIGEPTIISWYETKGISCNAVVSHGERILK